MALNWLWSEKCGEITLVQRHPDEEDRTFKFDLYEGNAYLIMIYEYEEHGETYYNVNSFFLDKEHAKRMLGLAKDYKDNVFDTPYQTITKLRIDKAKHRRYKDIVTLFAQAFDDITIEVYNSAKEG